MSLAGEALDDPVVATAGLSLRPLPGPWYAWALPVQTPPEVNTRNSRRGSEALAARGAVAVARRAGWRIMMGRG
eukprot:1159398-Pelagomonas_calceolata.AAC.29